MTTFITLSEASGRDDELLVAAMTSNLCSNAAASLPELTGLVILSSALLRQRYMVNHQQQHAPEHEYLPIIENIIG